MKVRLIPHWFRSWNWCILFQFHEGSINTKLIRISSILFLYFNSMKVRLIQDSHSATPTRQGDFNSMKVRLIRRRQYQDQDQWEHFNSMKVRLIRSLFWSKARGKLFQFHEGSINTIQGGSGVLGSLLFQFHEGSINTSFRHSANCYIRVFQFHEGSINTCERYKRTVWNWLFQFHEGSINTTIISIRDNSLSTISIPWRFD